MNDVNEQRWKACRLFSSCSHESDARYLMWRSRWKVGDGTAVWNTGRGLVIDCRYSNPSKHWSVKWWLDTVWMYLHFHQLFERWQGRKALLQLEHSEWFVWVSFSNHRHSLCLQYSCLFIKQLLLQEWIITDSISAEPVEFAGKRNFTLGNMTSAVTLQSSRWRPQATCPYVDLNGPRRSSRLLMTYLSRDIQLLATERPSIKIKRPGEVTPENVKKEVE